MRSVVFTGPGVVELRRTAVPVPRAGEVLVETAFVGLCATDAELFTGNSVYIREGAQHYPFTFGHEWSGRVAAVGADVSRYAIGDRVVGHPFLYCDACLECNQGRHNACRHRAEMGVQGDAPGAASDFFTVPSKVLRLVPEQVSLRQAVLTEPSVTAVRGLARVRCGYADRVAVLGGGTLGLVATQVAAAMGAVVDLIDVRREVASIAAEFGARRTMHPQEVGGDAYSVVVEASGSAAAAASVPALLAAGGRVAQLGVCHHPPQDYDLASITLKDAEIHGVLHGIEFYDQTLSLVADGALRPEQLIERVLAADEAEVAVRELAGGGYRLRPKFLLEFAGER